MDGWEATRRIKSGPSHSRCARALAISRQCQADSVKRAKDAGVDAYFFIRNWTGR